jgi:hypothetical protein
MTLGERLKKVICSESGCGTTVAELQGGVLLLKVKHHGETHTTVIYLPNLDTRQDIDYPPTKG